MPRAYDARAGHRAVFDALIDARDAHGAKKPILEDQERNPLSYTDLIRASFALGRKIAGFTGRGERVGVLLPSSAGVVVTFFAPNWSRASIRASNTARCPARAS